MTVQQAIGHLPEIEDGKPSEKDYLHYARKLTDISKKRIKATPEGGGWQDWDRVALKDVIKEKEVKCMVVYMVGCRLNNVAPTMTTYCIRIK